MAIDEEPVELSRMRAVDVSEYAKDWDATAATDVDHHLLALYNVQARPKSLVAKKIRNLLILSLRVQHHMPAAVIAEKVGLSTNRIYEVLRGLTGETDDPPAEVLL